MTKPTDRLHFLLLLRDDDPAAGLVYVRLRRALKSILRGFGLRCVRAEQHPHQPAGSLADAVGTGEELTDEESA